MQQDSCYTCITTHTVFFALLWFGIDTLAKRYTPRLQALQVAHAFVFEALVFLLYPLGGRFNVELLFRLSLGYFVYDLVLLVFFLPPRLDLILHHISSFVVIFYAASTHHLTDSVLWTLFIAEISSCLNNVRQLMKRAPKYHPVPFLWVQGAFVVSFFIGRFGLATKSVWEMLYTEGVPILVQYAVVLGWFVSVFWAYMISRYILAKYWKKGSSWKGQ
jgi:hypothetical protein